MKKSKKIISFLFSMIFCTAIAVGLPQMASAATNVLPLDAPVTKENIMSLLNEYDPDGAFILESTKEKLDYMHWWSDERNVSTIKVIDGEKVKVPIEASTIDAITEALDTAVHEQCHVNTRCGKVIRKGNIYLSEQIYIGNKKNIEIQGTKIYESNEMAESVPEKLRLDRYDIYVGSLSDNVGANVYGVYGLLNEFTSYNWGMNNTVSLFPYFQEFPVTMNTWKEYIHSGSSNRLAYGEFKYFILHYLYYAQENYPGVYNEIINNREFAKAYVTIENIFSNNIIEFEKGLKEIVKKGDFKESKSLKKHVENGYYKEDYEKFIKELEKTEYKDIENKLLLASGIEQVTQTSVVSTPEPENTGNPDGLSNKLLLEQIEVEKNVSIKKGSSRKLELTLPYGVTVVDKFTGRYGEVKVGYYSNNEDVATVNQNGDIKAKKKGTADITTIITFENHMSKVFTTKVTVKKDKKSGNVVVTKKNMKKLCNDLSTWLGVQVDYKIKPLEKVTYLMSKKTRRDIIAHVPDYMELHKNEVNGYYPDYNDKWNKISLRLFGKKTSDMQKPFLGDWGDGWPIIENIKIKSDKKNQYKVKADIYFDFLKYYHLPKEKRGSVVIYLKKSDKSSYGAAITKITVKRI